MDHNLIQLQASQLEALLAVGV